MKVPPRIPGPIRQVPPRFKGGGADLTALARVLDYVKGFKVVETVVHAQHEARTAGQRGHGGRLNAR